MSLLEIKIVRCTSETSDQECLPKEDIDEYFAKSTLGIYSMTKLVDLENLEEPIQLQQALPVYVPVGSKGDDKIIGVQLSRNVFEYKNAWHNPF